MGIEARAFGRVTSVRQCGSVCPVGSARIETEFYRLRLLAGLTVTETAAETGYAVRTIHRWDSGETTPRKAAVKYLRSQVASASENAGQFTFIDLFAGIGGLRRGFEAIGGQCVFTSEWEPLLPAYLPSQLWHR